MDNQIVQSKPINQGINLGVITIALLILVTIVSIYLSPISDPYIQRVLAARGDVNSGYAIFKINCAGCHGVEADGNVGPNLHAVSKRRSKARIIHQVISGETPPMPRFQPNTQEMADLLVYLEGL
ncbi:c-type cytochrome [Gloeocapsa sp. PCC 73106]|uniref:c-type cytochrome n=1 Tax=Gloeocapsa sp. PCC 73106 TaxID=102232 RepID=UPI0002ACB4DD|nr:c-type cytochrome [Gloeocapsa sp. PCC 73106]ELR98143.1 cytochrome c, mono- and diheme variants family [Gloeocapsa sp. PCC 73106]